jgi:uncharacterized membrane protein (UPF0136 family)
MNAHVILWIYIALMMLGGLMGFIKAGSKASLIASSAFSLLLVLFALDKFPFKHHVWVLLFLLIFFGGRFAKSKKFMPNGFMSLLSAIALILGFVLNFR